MLHGVSDVEFNYILCGVIWALAMGFAVGNYACSLVHRLPRGRLILDKKPYCGSCGAPLQVRDLFPVISAVLLRHRCRYCKTPFPVSHTWTELLVGLLFVLSYLQFNFSESYVLIVGLGVFWITLSAIESNERLIMGRILICILVFGMLLRTLADGSIYGFFEGGLYGLLLGALIWRKHIQKVGHIYLLPKQAQLLTISGVCVGSKNFIVFLTIYALLWLIAKFHALFFPGNKPLAVTIPFGFAVMLCVLYGPFSLASLVYS